MASTKIVVRKDKLNSEGLVPLSIRITHNRKAATIALNRQIKLKDWDAKLHKVKRSYAGATALNTLLQSKKIEIDTIVNEFLVKGQHFSVKDVVASYKGTTVDAKNLVDYLDDFIKTNPEGLQFNTLRNYKSTLSRLKGFDSKIKMEDVTPEWLEKFVKHLKKNHKSKTNTVHTRLKVIRKLIKLANRRGLISNDPFLNYSLKTEDSSREYLTQSELKTIEEFNPHQPSYQMVKNVFVFACYTGIRFSDCCTIKNENIVYEKDEDTGVEQYRIQFKMAKTKEVISFKLPSKAVNIIKLYGYPNENNGYLFPIIKGWKQIKTQDVLKQKIALRNAYFNKALKSMAKTMKLGKHISFHTSRHTFATLSLSLGIRMEVLSKLLGHSDLKTTQIYGKIMDKQKDDAMDLWG